MNKSLYNYLQASWLFLQKSSLIQRQPFWKGVKKSGYWLQIWTETKVT